MLTPRRRRGLEYLDDLATDPAVRERSLRDVRLSNTLFGGTHAVLSELARVLPALGRNATLLDVGTGLADIPLRARALGRQHDVRLATFAVDAAESLAHRSAEVLDAVACADARWLPFASSSVDIVICSQVLHHFAETEIDIVLRELDRVARRMVIVSDLRRSWIAAAAFWLAAWPLRFHAVTRHDGFVSVLRGFSARELSQHVAMATGGRARVRRHLGYRLTAVWTPTS